MPYPQGVPNDRTAREAHWHRQPGDDWACYDKLPAPIRHRMQEHAYDPWSVNTLALWRLFRRRRASSARAERSLLNHLDRLEAMERGLFDRAHRRAHGTPLPHVAARATTLRRAAP